MKRYALIIPMLLLIATCSPQFPTGPSAQVDFELIDAPTTPLSSSARAVMNGVYEVVQGRDVLGQTVVGKWIDQPWCLRWSLYSQHDVVFAETAGGSSADSSVKLIGYIRSVRSGSSVGVKLKILREDGAQELLAGTNQSLLIIRGTTEDGTTIELRRLRDITPSPFLVLAHQCGGRNSDRLGYSENSIPMIEHAAIFGATGIEMDVRATRDKYVILFHDNTFSPRTVQGIYLLGDVKNFDLAQIQSLGRLLNGESIPTLRDALSVVVFRTNLSLVWLDVKDPTVVDSIINIQKDIMDLAAANGRNLDVLMGIPNGADDVRAAYLNSQNPNRPLVDIVTEKKDDILLAFPNCKAWAPYWAEVKSEDITLVKSTYNKKVIIWTVDLQDIIRSYVKGANATTVDGILTNYSSLVTGILDSKR